MNSQKMRVILIGGGKFAGLLYYMFNKTYDFIGYIDDVYDHAYIEENYGLKKLGTSKDLPQIVSFCNNAIISIGSTGDASTRSKYYEKLAKIGFNFPSLISKTSIVADNAFIGSGAIIQQNVIIDPMVKIGKNCVISSGSIIRHDTKIGNNVFIAPSVILNGSSIIGDNTFIGTGATVIQKIIIGNNCIIGAASCAIEDIADNSKVAGVPARPIVEAIK